MSPTNWTGRSRSSAAGPRRAAGIPHAITSSAPQHGQQRGRARERRRPASARPGAASADREPSAEPRRRRAQRARRAPRTRSRREQREQAADAELPRPRGVDVVAARGSASLRRSPRRGSRASRARASAPRRGAGRPAHAARATAPARSADEQQQRPARGRTAPRPTATRSA